MSDVRACDICGALSDADSFEAGRGVLHVVTGHKPHPFAAILGESAPIRKYDLCPGCVRQFEALMEARRAGRA